MGVKKIGMVDVGVDIKGRDAMGWEGKVSETESTWRFGSRF